MKRRNIILALLMLCFIAPTAPKAYGELLGIEWNTGNLYEISTMDASLSLIGNTGLDSPDSLTFGPDGTLYTSTNGLQSDGGLYTIDPTTAAATFVGLLGVTQWEGTLAFAPNGTLYGAGVNGSDIYTIDLNTGAATVIGNIGFRDVSGMTFRSDGTLVAMEGTTGDNLYSIDLITFATTNIATLPHIGGIGGMTSLGDTAYMLTGRNAGGTNSLYTIDLFTGSTSLVGSFDAVINTGDGLSGLAIPVPVPGAVLLGILGLSAVGIKLRKYA